MDDSVRSEMESYSRLLPIEERTAILEMHEDYIMWHHWVEVANHAGKDIAVLQQIAREGLYLSEPLHAGD